MSQAVHPDAPTDRKTCDGPTGADSDAILAAFAGPIQSVTVPRKYRIGLFFVAFGMVLLPILYLGLIIAIACGVYYHATHFAPAIPGFKTEREFLFEYLAPLAGGVVVIFFMLKPLLARRAKPAEPRSLDSGTEPALFEFVRRICATVGAPMPRRIDVDWQVNASASLRRGLRSFFDDDLVLTIGLPLVAGLDTRQFAAILAHEFGHFSQRTAMRLTFVVRAISHWFARVVYERDAWDRRIASSHLRRVPQLNLVLAVVLFCIWFSRRVLWCLMQAGHAISCFMLRQMEFDADRYAARTAGSEVEREVSTRMAELAVSFHTAADASELSWNEGRLPEDLPVLVQLCADRIPAEDKRQLCDRMMSARTRFFDTHPAARDRIASAEAERAPGVFTLRVPARSLFLNFGSLAKNISLDCYQANLGPASASAQFVPTLQFADETTRKIRQSRAEERFFQEVFNVIVPVFPDDTLFVPPPARSDIIDCIRAARAELDANANRTKETMGAFARATRVAAEVECARTLVKTKVTINKKTFSVPLTNLKKIGKARQQNELEIASALQQIQAVRRLVQQRLACCIALGDAHGVVEANDNDDNPAAVARYVDALRAIGRCADAIHRMEVNLYIIQVASTVQSPPVTLKRAIEALGRETSLALTNLRDALQATRYPFDHARGGMSIAEYMVETLPIADNIENVFQAGSQAAYNIRVLCARLQASVASYAERVEAAVGLPVDISTCAPAVLPSAV